MSLSMATGGSTRGKSVRRVLWIVLVLNLAVAFAKLAYGIVSHSASMQADGIHSAFDGIGNVIALVGVALAARPADEGHPYGHSKFETYASLAIGVLLVIAAIEVGSGAIDKLMSKTYTAEVTTLSFVVMVGTLVVNVLVTVYERLCARRYQSDILRADASHTLSDALVSIGVIVGLVCVRSGVPEADPVMALVVTVFILISAIEVFARAFRTLSDHARIDVKDIQRIADGLPGIIEVRHIRTRGTESEVYCDLHLLVDPDLTVRAAHAIGDCLELEIKQEHPNVCEVLVHIEPYGIEQDEEQIGGLSVKVPTLSE